MTNKANTTEDKLDRQLNDNQRYQGIGEFFRFRRDLKLHHKILYITLGFIGLNFCWYAVWTTIAETAFINIPIVAAIIGVGLMIITGKLKDLA